MPATNVELRRLVGVSVTESSDAELDGYLEIAVAIVDEYLFDLPAEVVIPFAVLDRAYVLVAAELFGQDQAPNGVLNQQYETEGGPVATPVRISADPLRPAYALLSPWRTVTIA